ncbi:MAG: hypothetical protein K5877_07560 [Lachnospiraceae bacterium]|nr:hypothetical protein [Lachnospiraceae bacterium]
MADNKNLSKEEKEKNYAIASSHKFTRQKQSLIKPFAVCFGCEAILYIILLIIETPAVLFDESSILFSGMLLFNTVIPGISLIIILFAKQSSVLLVTISLHQICIVTLIIGLFAKYDLMKQASAYDNLLVFYFIYFVAWLIMTTVLFNVKTKINSLEKL